MEAVRDALVADLDAFKADRDEINGDLGAVNSCLPGGVDLGSMEPSGSNLKVTASAGSVQDILRYGENLRASGRFDLVVITSVGSGGGEGHGYTATIMLTKVI